MPPKNEQSKSGPTGEALDKALDDAFGPMTVPLPEPASSGIPEQPSRPAWPLIYGKLAAVMRELPAVGKDSKNKEQGWNFRGVDAVVNAVSPALRKHGVIVIPETEKITYRDTMTAGREPRPTREVTVQVRYTFYAEDGSSVTAVVPGESLDQSDKGSAKAMSVAFRIVLLQVFSLPTSEPDPDATYHTRDGVGSMTEHVRKLLLEQVPTASIAGLEDIWAIVLEHSAAERNIGEAEITWADYVGQALAAMVAQVETYEDGVLLGQAINNSTVAHLSFQGKTLYTLMSERAQFIAKRRAESFDKHMAAILAAETPEGVGVAFAAATDDRMAKILSADQINGMLELARDRSAKLERELNQAAPQQDATTNPELHDATVDYPEPSGAGDE